MDDENPLMMHPLLKSQLEDAGLDPTRLPDDFAAWTALLTHVSQAYAQSEEALRRANDTLEQRTQARLAELAQTSSALETAIEEHRQTESVLQQEHNLLRTIIDTMPAEVYVKDLEGHFVEANAETYLKLGSSASEVIGKTDFDYFPTEMARSYRETEQVIMRTGQPMINFEEKILDMRTGEEAWLLTTKAPLRNARGEIIGIVGMGVEITERKRIEEALEAERTLLRTLIDAIPDYVYIKDLDSRFVMANRAAAQGLGVAHPEDLIGRTDFSFHPAALAQQFYDEEQALFRTGKATLNQEERIIDQRTGDWQQLLSTNIPLYDKEGRIVGLVGINRDITEHNRAQLALEESEERYRTVTNLIATYAFSMRVEPDGAVIDEWSTDEAFSRFTGYTWDEVTDATVLYHPDDVHAVESQVHDLMSGEAVSLESRIITKDGRLRWMHIHRLPVWDKTQNRVVRYYGVAQDITERKQVEEARRESERLRLALEKEKELGDLKTKLMVTISHEFRTPLSIAYTSAEMLERYYERMTLDQRENHLQQVQGQIKQLIGMLEDISLLIYARFGQLTLNRELADLRKMTEAAIQRLEDFESARDRIDIHIDEPMPELRLDVRRVQYILTNLLSNALKYSPSTEKISLELLKQDAGVLIRVTDRGIGISREEQDRLFEPFYRANNVGEISGTGLGLSIVKEIVEMHRGTITVESEVHQGTTMSVYLPGE